VHRVIPFRGHRDTAIIFVGGGFSATTPSNWNAFGVQTGSNWQGSLFSKILSAAEITTGSVSVSMGGTFDTTVAIATLIGNCIITQVVSSRNGNFSPSTVVLTTSSHVLTTDFAIYFGAERANATDTVSRGTMRRQVADGSLASGCLYTEDDLSAVTPPISTTTTYGGSAGNYQAIAIVSPLVMAAPKDIPITWTRGTSGSRPFLNPGLTGGMNG
jgi:hypothetical protein